MKSSRRFPFRWLSVSLILAGGLNFAEAQIRIVTYNTNAGPRTDSGTVLDAINTDSVAGIAKPIDILLLQESTSTSTTTQSFANLLNGLPTTPSQNYVVGNLNGGTSGGGRPTVVYNSNAVTLIEEIAFGTVNTSAQARQTLRYRFRPVGYDSAADFYVYNNHYKAGDTTTDRNRRQVEAAALRANADALGDGVNLLYAGDFNVSSNLETMWTTLRASGNGQVFDPINREGIWGNSSTFRDIHTQSPVTAARFSGQTTGGMDDRFDFQLLSSEMLDGEGLAYIPGTYRAFGNNGTHPLNGEIDNVANTAEPINVLTALANSSDHLPVIADYQLPAVLSVNVIPAPSRVIQDASVSLDVTVSNAAQVLTANGADELDYLGSTTGALAGSFSGTDQALGGGQNHSVTLATSTVGSQVGNLQVMTSSEAAANPVINTPVAFDVLAHSNASFSSSFDQNVLSIDFGIVGLGQSVASQAFSISNLLSVFGITANLDLDQIVGSGDTSAFSVNFAPTFGIDAGTSAAFQASLSTAVLDILSASYTFSVSDENLLGAIAGDPLTLNLSATVARPGDANLDGFVTGADFAALQIAFGGPGDWSDGDFNGDGAVTGADFAILQINFGTGGPFPPSFGPVLQARVSDLFATRAVPEVSPWILLTCGAMAYIAMARFHALSRRVSKPHA